MSEGSMNGLVPNHRPDGRQEPDRAASPRSAENATGEANGRDNERFGNALAQEARKDMTNQRMRDELDNAVSRLNDFVQSVQRDLAFEVHDETGETVVKVIDPETDQVIRQIPDELALKMAENLQQEEPITLLNIRV